MSLRPLEAEVARQCGIGEGANCCAFLVIASTGFACAQRDSIADMFYTRAHAGEMKARRTPESDFPTCQTEGRS